MSILRKPVYGIKVESETGVFIRKLWFYLDRATLCHRAALLNCGRSIKPLPRTLGVHASHGVVQDADSHWTDNRFDLKWMENMLEIGLDGESMYALRRYKTHIARLSKK